MSGESEISTGVPKPVDQGPLISGSPELTGPELNAKVNRIFNAASRFDPVVPGKVQYLPPKGPEDLALMIKKRKEARNAGHHDEAGAITRRILKLTNGQGL